MSATDFVAELLAGVRNQLEGKTNLWDSARGEALGAVLERMKGAPDETAIEFTLASVRVIRDEEQTWVAYVLNQATASVLRRKLPFSEDQAVEMLELASAPRREFPLKGILNAVASLPMTPRLSDTLLRLRPWITEYLGGSEARDLRARIDNLVSGPPADSSFEAQGAWSHVVFKEIAESPQRSAWERILLHTAELKSSEASKKWRATAQQLVAELGRDVFLEAASRWLAMGPSPNRPGVQISSGEVEFLTGFLWFLADQTDERIPALLANFAAASLKKIPALGAVSQKVGNACVNVLAELPGTEPVAQLSRLGQQVRYDTAQRLIEKALTRAAEKAGVSRDQLEELSVPDCGLGSDGALLQRFGDFFVRVSTEETTSAVVSWTDNQGRALKGAPTYVKENHAAEWKDLQQTVKDMEKMLSAHRTRIERLLLTQRAIPIDTLRTCYLNHPLLADMARRLIWQFESGLGMWRNGRIIDDTDREIDLATQKTARLWHPVVSGLPTIFHWRSWLEDKGIRQPFKQAHREVYLITEAERQTGVYSNRFAGHLLRQHQFSALCEQRGWEYRLMGQWDSHNTPTLELPQFDLRVEYDVNFPRDESQVSGHFIYLLIRTEALRFFDANREPRALESIPPYVFSEVMRDVDLFTGITSIGSDAAWGQKESNPFREYWIAFSFGDLTEMAQTRKSVLERLIPRLPLKDCCRIEGRFLIVRGRLATYRIHLGSGNVLMEPGSRYLCIVEGAANKASPRNLALPFEQDSQLSLILSKAFLLADESKIKDQSILRQLH